MSMLPAVQFTIPGRLGGKQRVGRDFRQGMHHTFNPRQTASQESVVAHLAAMAKRDARCAQLEGPLHLEIMIFRRTPASWSKKRQAVARWITGKPDVDNTVKLIADGLNHSGVWSDDSQVAKLSLERCYANLTAECVIVTVRQLEDTP